MVVFTRFLHMDITCLCLSVCVMNAKDMAVDEYRQASFRYHMPAGESPHVVERHAQSP